MLSCNAAAIGTAACVLGAGRQTKDDVIDHLSGIILCKKPGDRVECGDVLAVLHTAKANAVAEAECDVLCALQISDSAPKLGKMIYCTVR